MYCKKCRFHSFDHVGTCPKCGADWDEARKALYLNWITASGFNWLAPAASAAETAGAAAPGAMPTDSDDLLDSLSEPSAAQVFAPAPTPPSGAPGRDEDIDVSIFPELDFTATASAPTAPAPKRDEDIFLDSLPVEEIVELDFGTSDEAPAAPKAQPLSKPKREDLFIPELEEMLAPLTDEPRTSPAPAKKPSLSDETEIILDFGSDPGTSSGSDLGYLELEDTGKKS
jgi:hypothetical protein